MSKLNLYLNYPVVIKALEGVDETKKSIILEFISNYVDDEHMHEFLYASSINALKTLDLHQFQEASGQLNQFIPAEVVGFQRVAMLRHLVVFVEHQDRGYFIEQMKLVFDKMPQDALHSDVTGRFCGVDVVEIGEKVESILQGDDSTFNKVMTELSY